MRCKIRRLEQELIIRKLFIRKGKRILDDTEYSVGYDKYVVEFWANVPIDISAEPWKMVLVADLQTGNVEFLGRWHKLGSYESKYSPIVITPLSRDWERFMKGLLA